jgi:hypothetical protein
VRGEEKKDMEREREREKKSNEFSGVSTHISNLI